MKFWTNLKKYGVPFILGSMTVESWISSKRESFKEKILEEALKKGIKKENALDEANKKAEETIQMLKTKLTASSNRLENCVTNVTEYSRKIEEINNQINNTKDSKEIEFLISKLNNYREMYKESVKIQEQSIKEIQSLSDINDPDIVNSDFSGLFNKIIDNYKEFLTSLSSEQMVIVFNILGYTMLLFTLTSITTLLIGDQIINFLKLESKYPKLVKYIKLKQTLNKHYLRFYIVLFYILLLLLISINIFMFSFEYFL